MNQTLTDIAADMWNHLPKMKQPPPALALEEMREILSYIWAPQRAAGLDQLLPERRSLCRSAGHAQPDQELD